MKFLAVSLVASVSLWANSAEVHYESVTLVIEGNTTTYQKGAKFDLPYEKEICMVKGDGLLTIQEVSGEEQQLMIIEETKKCTTLYKPKVKIVEQKSLWEQVKAFFTKQTVEDRENGISKKGEEE
jgi:hypothetical protein